MFLNSFFNHSILFSLLLSLNKSYITSSTLTWHGDVVVLCVDQANVLGEIFTKQRFWTIVIRKAIFFRATYLFCIHLSSRKSIFPLFEKTVIPRRVNPLETGVIVITFVYIRHYVIRYFFSNSEATS